MFGATWNFMSSWQQDWKYFLDFISQKIAKIQYMMWLLSDKSAFLFQTYFNNLTTNLMSDLKRLQSVYCGFYFFAIRVLESHTGLFIHMPCNVDYTWKVLAAADFALPRCNSCMQPRLSSNTVFWHANRCRVFAFFVFLSCSAVHAGIGSVREQHIQNYLWEQYW